MSFTDDEAARIERALAALSGETDGAKESHFQERLTAESLDALVMALAGCDDPSIHTLEVLEVAPVRGGSCLKVVVRTGDRTSPPACRPTGDGCDETDRIAAKLARAQGYLRRELAAALSRKRTPELRFVVLPAGAVPAP